MKIAAVTTVTLFALTLSTTTVARADDSLQSDPSTDLTRLNYYPHSGKLYLAPDIQAVPTDLSIPSNGEKTENTGSTHSWQVDFDAIYGLPIAGLRIGYSQTYLAHRWSDTVVASNGFVNQTGSSGLSDPTFALQYRYYETGQYGFSGDISFNVSPSWVTADISTSGSSGSDGKGYGTAELIAAQYYLLPSLDFGLSEGLSRQFSGNAVNQVKSTSSYDRSSTWVLGIAPTVRAHITPELYAQASATFDFAYSYDETSGASPSVTTTESFPFRAIPALLVGYLIHQNMTLDALYTYQNYTHTGSAPSSATVSTFAMENTFELRARLELL